MAVGFCLSWKMGENAGENAGKMPGKMPGKIIGNRWACMIHFQQAVQYSSNNGDEHLK